MYFRGSRYRNLPQSSPINADGQRLRGTDLRVIAPTPGTFLHRVQVGDRFDLLALKYYNDASRWWQICDANPEFAFPNDLLDRAPVVAERLALVNPGGDAAFQDFVTSLGAFGGVLLAEGDFNKLTVVVSFATAAARASIIQAAATSGYSLLGSFAWAAGANIVEAFTLEDAALKLRWREILQGLAALPGVLELQSDMAAAVIRLAYNATVTTRVDVRSVVEGRGFAVVEPQSFPVERLGAPITVPPDGNS